MRVAAPVPRKRITATTNTNFSPLCLAVRMASKTVMRSIYNELDSCIDKTSISFKNVFVFYLKEERSDLNFSEEIANAANSFGA